MEIHVLNAGQSIGPFPSATVVAMARAGSLSPDAQVWHDGVESWYPLSEFLLRPEELAATAAGVESAEETDEAGPPLTSAELQRRVLEKKRAALAADSGEETMLVLRALGAGLGVAVLGGGLYLLTLLLTKPLLIPGPIVLIGMAIGGTISKVGRGEGSALLPMGAVLLTLLAYLMVGFPLAWLHLLFLGMGMFFAFKLTYL